MALLPATYFPAHEDNLMRAEGDTALARKRFFEERPGNLRFLLEQRYAWMNEYLDGKRDVVELGSGAGFAREFLRNPNLRLTDVSGKPWIDQCVDAMKLPFADGWLDAIVCSHMIHHVAQPVLFFREASRALKPGGAILISEINTSWMMRALLRLMRHEGWSYDIDVFDETRIANDPRDPWSANCAIPQLLFADRSRFESALPTLKVERFERCECLIFPLSGGVIARSPTIPLPNAALRGVHALDQLLVAVAPRVFALGMRVVIRKA